MSAPRDLAAEGRARLAEMKAAHVVDTCDGACRECDFLHPCDAARLVAAVEEALLHTESVERDDEILSKLADR